MRTTVEYLDAVKTRLDITSDYALAKALGVAQQLVSGYRVHGRSMGDEAAFKVAELLGIDPMLVIAHANQERAKTKKQRELWATVSDRFSGISEKISGSFNRLASPAKRCIS